MAQLIALGGFVGPGEEATAQYLRDRLPDSWTVIANKELVERDGSAREIDLVVVADHCVFAIEEKSWGGTLRGNENGWVLPSGESAPSPINRIASTAKRLAGVLRERVPGLRERLEGHFVFGRVLLSAAEVKVLVNDPRQAEFVLYLDGCEHELLDFDQRQAGTTADLAPLARLAVERLTGLPDRPRVPRRVGNYSIERPRVAPGLARSFAARHDDGTERVLKLVPLVDAAGRVSDADRAARRREYEALRRLAESGVTPAVDPYFEWEDGRWLVLPIEPVRGQSLRSRRLEHAPDQVTFAQVWHAAFEAVSKMHQLGVVHRAISPDRIVVRPDGRVAFVDLAIAQIAGEQTVAAVAEQLDPEDRYRAPEYRVDPGLCSPASDVYSTALALWVYLSGEEPDDADSCEPSLLGELRPDLSPAFAAAVSDGLQRCLAEDDRVRPAAAELVGLLDAFAQSAPKPAAERFAPDELVAGRYRVRRRLGAGSSGETFLAYDETDEIDRVLKLLRDPERQREQREREFRALENLKSRYFPKICQTLDLNGTVILVLEYIAGDLLRDRLASFQRQPEALLGLARDALAALQELERASLVHRDISPDNLLLPERSEPRVMLLDFGLATPLTGSSEPVGRRSYRDPALSPMEPWNHQADLYAMAVTLYEAYTGQLPGSMSDESCEEGLAEDALLRVLRKACAPARADRYATAAEFSRALESAVQPVAPIRPGHRDGNRFVDALRGAFRNSSIGNADNRALDSDFARGTYVPTRLDTELLPSVLRGEWRLVILSGNPGDGKTSLLQRLHVRLLDDGAEGVAQNEAGWRMTLGGHVFVALYDASEAHDGQSADALMAQVLEPLSGQDEPSAGYTACIAANDGRLMQYFMDHAAEYRWVWDRLQPQLFDEAPPRDGILLVDLKHRSVVPLDEAEDSLFERILDTFVAHEPWAACDTCCALQACPMRFNVASMRPDSELGRQVRARLRLLLAAVHLQRERRPTLRDLRSCLAWLITGDWACETVYAALEEGQNPLITSQRLYYQSAFSGDGRPDLFLDGWQLLDPASATSPALDRALYFASLLGPPENLDGVHLPADGRPSAPPTTLVDQKRRFFFEAAPIHRRTAGLDLPAGEDLLPYGHLLEFEQVLAGTDDELDRCLDRILRGLSCADRVRLNEPGLALRLNRRTRSLSGEASRLLVVKLLPREQFRLERLKAPPGTLVETMPEGLRLKHERGPHLDIDLDLFEMLLRLAAGTQPDAEEQQALLEELETFRDALLAEPTQSVLLVEPNHRPHRVTVENNRTIRLHASGERR